MIELEEELINANKNDADDESYLFLSTKINS